MNEINAATGWRPCAEGGERDMATTFWKMGMFGCTSAPVSITSESPSSIMACCASASVGSPVGRTLFCLLILPFLSFGILFCSSCDSEAVISRDGDFLVNWKRIIFFDLSFSDCFFSRLFRAPAIKICHRPLLAEIQSSVRRLGMLYWKEVILMMPRRALRGEWIRSLLSPFHCILHFSGPAATGRGGRGMA